MSEPNFEREYELMDAEERALHDALSDAIDTGEFVMKPPSAARTKELQDAARQSISERNQLYNTRLHPHDIEALNKIAEERGMPPQALLSSIVHEYVEGRLVEKG